MNCESAHETDVTARGPSFLEARAHAGGGSQRTVLGDGPLLAGPRRTFARDISRMHVGLRSTARVGAFTRSAAVGAIALRCTHTQARIGMEEPHLPSGVLRPPSQAGMRGGASPTPGSRSATPSMASQPPLLSIDITGLQVRPRHGAVLIAHARARIAWRSLRRIGLVAWSGGSGSGRPLRQRRDAPRSAGVRERWCVR